MKLKLTSATGSDGIFPLADILDAHTYSGDTYSLDCNLQLQTGLYRNVKVRDQRGSLCMSREHLSVSL